MAADVDLETVPEMGGEGANPVSVPGTFSDTLRAARDSLPACSSCDQKYGDLDKFAPNDSGVIVQWSKKAFNKAGQGPG